MGAATEDDVQHAGGEIVIERRFLGGFSAPPESSCDIGEILSITLVRERKDQKSGIVLDKPVVPQFYVAHCQRSSMYFRPMARSLKSAY